jgi:transposase
MKGIPRGRYTKEFRQEAVKLGNWVKAYQEGKLGEIGKTYRPLTEMEMELAKVKKENTILKMENEILKKAAAYFARESLPGMRT